MIGVTQPAIAKMLERQSRPQWRTIVKIAAALELEAKELRPGFQEEV